MDIMISRDARILNTTPLKRINKSLNNNDVSGHLDKNRYPSYPLSFYKNK
jgi:hypothetical protein